MAIVKIPTERERERRHDEDVCNLFLTRVEFHHGPTTSSFLRTGIIIFRRLNSRVYEYGDGFPYNFSRSLLLALRSEIVRSSPCVSTGEFWPVAERGEEEREMWSEREAPEAQPKTVASCPRIREESLASIDHRGTIIQEPERDGLNADESRTVHWLFALFAWVTQGMCVALVCIVAMMHPPMDREEARYNLPTSIEERGERVGWAG